jgi:hypothetical protein
MSDLYIYGGKDNKNLEIDSSSYIYFTNIGNIFKNGCSIQDMERVNDIALEYRDEYVEYINSINSKFLDLDLVYDEKISMFFFTDLFNKRTEIFDTFVSICHLLYLKERVSTGLNIDKIFIFDCTDMFAQALKSTFPDKIIVEKGVQKNKSNIKNFYLMQLKFFIKTAIQVLLIKIFFKENHSVRNINRLFLSRYPLHFDKNFTEEKYGDMVSKTDWYLISMITDGMHQNHTLTTILKSIKELKSKKQFILLDNFLTIKDVVNGLLQSYRLGTRKKLLIKQKYSFKDIDVSKYIYYEIQQSFLRLPRLFIYRNALIRTFSNKNVKKFIFYLHEYSYGRYFNYIIANYAKEVERIGFQHGPASRRKVLYYLGVNKAKKGITTWRNQLPLPNKILAEDELSVDVYREAGYTNIVLMTEIYRMKYLKNIIRKVAKQKQVLIVPGLHDGDALLQYIFDDIIRNKDVFYLFKPHPRSTLAKAGINDNYNAANLSMVNGHISTFLSTASSVITTYSSVGYEAYLLKIPVQLVSLPNMINDSPLLDIEEKEELKLITIQWDRNRSKETPH